MPNVLEFEKKCITRYTCNTTDYTRTLLPPNKDHMMDNDKQGHDQTWEFWCDNNVHTEKY